MHHREPLSTGQSRGRYCDPISMEVPSQTFKSQLQIELRDSRVVGEEARADNHVAPAAHCSSARRQVSIAPPVTYADIPEPIHKPRVQSTRYHLSPQLPHENSTFVENTMELTSGADATGIIIPETTAGEPRWGRALFSIELRFFHFQLFRSNQRVALRRQSTRGETAAE